MNVYKTAFQFGFVRRRASYCVLRTENAYMTAIRHSAEQMTEPMP